MDSSTARICKTCGYPYHVDDSSDTHMDPPDDYRRGYQRYCLACWLGVGPEDSNLFGDTTQPVPREKPKASKTSVTKDRIHRRQLRQPEVGNPSLVDAPKPSVYLWLRCEGWMKFGPFEWLRFDDRRQAILDSDGAEVAKKVDGCRRVPGEKWQGWVFSDPTVTTTPVHPHRKSGEHPGGAVKGP